MNVKFILILYIFYLIQSPVFTLAEDDHEYRGESTLNVENNWIWIVKAIVDGDLFGLNDDIALEWRSNASTTGQISCSEGLNRETGNVYKHVTANEKGKLSLTAKGGGPSFGGPSCQVSVMANPVPNDNKTVILIDYAYNWDGEVDLDKNGGWMT
jgi:hypothetical protein